MAAQVIHDQERRQYNSNKDIMNPENIISTSHQIKSEFESESKEVIEHPDIEVDDKSSVSNSSMNMSSDSSSSLKLEEVKEQNLNEGSNHSGDDSDLLKIETDTKFLKKQRRQRVMQRSATEVLPLLKVPEDKSAIQSKIVDFNKLDDLDIPLKKSASSIRVLANSKKDIIFKEHEDNDKLREDMNKRYIIKKFNEIKAKTYASSDHFMDSNDRAINPNSEKKKYVMHVTESELKIIRKNRNLLLDLGAMLFWDHKYDNIRNEQAFFHHADSLNEKKIEFQISGNFSEVEKAKEAVIFLLNYERKIEKEQVVVIEIDMWIPKVLIRKVVGYHEKNLIDYFKKFDVSISYDSNLINNEFYPVYDQTMITIKGKKAFAEIVASDINDMLTKLIIRTIHLAPADCKYLKEKICQLKCRIDPAELRICRTTKQQKIINMNHPFFHIPAYYKEILIIGDKDEVAKAESEIYKFLREEKINNQNIYTLSILIPFTIQPDEYNSYVERIKEKYMVDLQTYEAIPPRKHATAMLIGTWENICLAKDMMVDWVEKQRNMQMSRWTDYDKFDKMILNQQIRFTYKSLKRYIIEKHVKYLKHWDLTSHTVVRELPEPPQDSHDKEKTAFYDMAQGETDSLQFFMKQVDSETAINVLFATNSKTEFARLMDKYSLKKREVIEKCYELLVDNMREYNFIGQRSRNNDTYHYNSNYNDSYYNSNKYESSNRYYQPSRHETGSRFSGGTFHQDNFAAQEQEVVQPYSGRFKNLLDNPQPSEVESQVIKQEVESQEKPRSPSREDKDRRSYRYEHPSFYRSNRDKYDRRSRHYIGAETRHSGYTSHRRSSHRRSSHRRSSSKQSSSRSRRHRHY